jgi:hypothetical protein
VFRILGLWNLFPLFGEGLWGTGKVYSIDVRYLVAPKLCSVEGNVRNGKTSENSVLWISSQNTALLGCNIMYVVWQKCIGIGRYTIFFILNPSGFSMVLELTEILTEMRALGISWCKGSFMCRLSRNPGRLNLLHQSNTLIHSFSSLSYDRCKASSKSSSPHSAI